MSQNNSILGTITQAEQQLMYKRLDNARATLNAYIKHYETKLKTMKGSGLTKKQKGGNVVFFNDPNQLLKNCPELIIGEILAGNNSVKMGNTGVSILDTLLKTSTINKSQLNKLYKKYFKI